MRIEIYLCKSKAKGKRLAAKIKYPDGKVKTINFGSIHHSNYLIHQNDERKKRYIDRHKSNENWNEINSGSLSRYLLWGEKTLDDSIKKYEKMFNVKIHY